MKSSILGIAIANLTLTRPQEQQHCPSNSYARFPTTDTPQHF